MDLFFALRPPPPPGKIVLGTSYARMMSCDLSYVYSGVLLRELTSSTDITYCVVCMTKQNISRVVYEWAVHVAWWDVIAGQENVSLARSRLVLVLTWARDCGVVIGDHSVSVNSC